MRAYSLDHLSDPELLRALTALVTRERITTAELLAHIAEVDARRLYAPAGYPSMHAYCVEELRLSEDSAFRRIRAARTARQYPVIFTALADGRLSLTAVILLTPYLSRANAAGLLKAAVHKSRSEIEELLARRFPRTELLPMVEALPGQAPRPDGQLAPAPVGNGSHELAMTCGVQLAPAPVQVPTPEPGAAPETQLAPAPVENGSRGLAMTCGVQLAPAPVMAPRPTATPSAPGRYALHVTIARNTHEKLRHAQALLSHRLPTGDLASVLDLALDALVEKLEKRKFAKTDRPRPRRRRGTANPRHIPAHVKRAVWERDGGRCTFVGDTGHRCDARKFLEYDHVNPVARGGRSTVTNLRLRCRAHNHYEAERAFGAGFMEARRARSPHPVSAQAYPDGHADDVMAALRSLGVRGEDARRATSLSANAAGDALEDRVRAALKSLWPRGAHRNGATASATPA